MKKIVSLFICMILLCGTAAAQTVSLPNSGYVLELPDGMKYSMPEPEDYGMAAYTSETLEMDYVSYLKADAFRQGMAETLRETAENLAASGEEAELRDVNGVQMLIFRMTDDADGASGIGYVFEDGEWIIEINFWYATQEAAEETEKIISSIRKK
ncbi:MAG: hypothetical protein IKZ98_00725 [Clostridia bacterium]|uniref:Uncharacterized protein n=1 Tax=Aristaeella lactis TaxID=3046383 RepID=A0AC61PP14_9FIRM|nr:hypothetical protein [Aristaeella lactis]MBR5959493.1 hypothetical protein [Clostridia bacterium]QUA53307.1 hypothetical protein JYE50_01365 [Aristaeella lactis]SMC80469.1 hypothetical protein SAMN06297397_2598 [Aristaeella lactis]